MGAPHHYRISAAKPTAHLFEVGITVDSPDPAGQLFRMPAWIPGSYLIRDLARNVVHIRAESDGREVLLTKVDNNSWQADACAAPLTVIAEIYAGDLSVRGAYLDATHGFFDGACVFPAVVGQEDRTCILQIERPPKGADWRVATSMRAREAEPYEFGTYFVDDYAELIDHPVQLGNLQIGEFEAGGVPHAIAVRGATRFDMARLCHDLKTLCEYQLGFLGKPESLDRYLFLLTVREKGYGGLEHRWSSSLMCSRSDLPRKGESVVSNGYRKFLGLCSHEYFHLWNVKRIKPERFTPYRLHAESHTGLLWVFEGITSYYDDLALLRSGLISAESYLELLGRTITRVLRARGRHLQSVEESSFDAWTRFYKQDANSSNSVISYYTKGAIVALALDMTIRKDSAGRHSLDDVMRACWSRYGETGVGLPERGLESLAREVTGLELIDFFDRYVRGTVDPPLERLLKEVGVTYHARPATDSRDAGGKPVSGDAKPPPWLGVSIPPNVDPDKFGVVHSGSPAEKAGISPGDEPVSIDDLRLTTANLDERLAGFHEGDHVMLRVFRNDELLSVRVRLGKPPEDTCYLTLDDDVNAANLEARELWLNSRDKSS